MVQPAPTKSGRIEASGVHYYYELHGAGEPLLLLHGGLGSIEMFAPVLPVLAEGRQVIGIDLHGHGRTPLGDRKINLPDMGDDMAVLIEKLGLEQVDVLGYSLGGGVAFRLAAQHPSRVRRLVLVSAGYAQDGFYPEMLPMQAQVGAAMAESMKDTPMYLSYAAVAPAPDEFPELLERMGEWMRQPYDWEQDVKKLTMPVMLVFGDSDMFRLEHVVRFYQLLGGGLKDAGWMREHMSGEPARHSARRHSLRHASRSGPGANRPSVSRRCEKYDDLGRAGGAGDLSERVQLEIKKEKTMIQKKVGDLDITLPSDREMTMTRIFDAPRDLVWKAYTDPELVARWWGRGNKLVIERLEVERGGHWRFVEHGADGVHGFEGRFREVTPPERLVQTFEWDGMPGYVSVNTTTFEDLDDGRTRVIATAIFHTPEERDGMLNSGMEQGLSQSYAALDRLLAEMA